MMVDEEEGEKGEFFSDQSGRGKKFLVGEV